MTTQLVLTVIGDDRPGLVESLAQVIAAHQGNWLDSNMSRLAGKFAGILRVAVDNSQVDILIQQLRKMSDDPSSLRIIVERAAPEEPARLRTLRLHLVGNDRPGIIREISRALAAQQVNVEALETHCSSAPMSGELLFNAEAVLHVPDQLDLDNLQRELEQLADDLIVDITLARD